MAVSFFFISCKFFFNCQNGFFFQNSHLSFHLFCISMPKKRKPCRENKTRKRASPFSWEHPFFLTLLFYAICRKQCYFFILWVYFSTSKTTSPFVISPLQIFWISTFRIVCQGQFQFTGRVTTDITEIQVYINSCNRSDV